MSVRRLILTILASLCALAGGLLAGASAPAAVTHDYLSQITEVPSQGLLKAPHAMTVDSGELYVAEGAAENYKLDRFNASTGAFLSQFPQVPALSYLYQGVAVGHATGEAEVYVGGDEFLAGPEGTEAVFSAAGGLQATWKEAQGEPFGCFECSAPGDVAVDNSASLGDWAAGDVYVSVPEREVVDVFKAEAGGARKYVTQIRGVSPSEPFSGLRGVTVDGSSGDVIIVAGSAIDVFKPTMLGEYEFVRQLTGTPAGAFSLVRNVAVDGGSGEGSGDIYVAQESEVDQFSSEGTYLGRLTGTPLGSFAQLQSVAVDPTSHRLYVGDYGEAGVVDVFEAGLVIPDVVSESASTVKPTSAVLEGTVDPDGAGPATCRFVWGTSTEFGQSAPCSAPVANGSGAVGVHALISGLQPDSTYYYRLQASNKNGTNPSEAFQDRQFTTPGPGTRDESASNVASTSATLGAQIDPDGTPTSYYFQYGTSSSYGADVPILTDSSPYGLTLGSIPGYVEVDVHLQGLQAGAAYHYRVVTVSEPTPGQFETFTGADQVFSTQAVGGESALPDGRAWELVTPPYKQGAGLVAVGNEEGEDIQAAADGSAITYTATAPFVTNPAGSRSLEATQVFSSRSTPGNWETSDISTAHNEGATALQVGHAAEYKLFSSDLSLGAVEPEGDTPLPPLPAGSEKTVYLREASGGYQALVTSANVFPGTKFGGNGETGAAFGFISANPDFSDVVISSEVALTAAPSAEGGLYEWSGGQLRLASVLPNHKPTPAALGEDDFVVRNAISKDGSRLVFKAGSPERLYLRDMVRGETVQVDAAQGRPEPASIVSHYVAANSDDSRVFFTSKEHLTADPMTSESGEDLYVFEVNSSQSEPLAGKLEDLTVDPNAGESAGVLGVIGASEDGSYVYFVAQGVLGDGAGRGAEKGGYNLYLERYEGGSKAWALPIFIAKLSSKDSPSWGGSTDNGHLQEMTARVSPNGQYLAFMSERSLTGYENRDANSGARDEEVFLYEASTAHVVCVSCDPTGARPLGLFEGQKYEENLVDYAKNWENRWLAGNIPGWTTAGLSHALYQSRYLSDSGRLFFDSSDALVPGDVNGKEDVYEYEPSSIGGCRSGGGEQNAGDVLSESAGGCIALISSGTSGEESAFMDASETGGDVFFLTLSRLAPQDNDTSIDLYDAHECTSSSPCAPAAALVPPPCTTGDACKAAPTPQPAAFGAPASATFSGAGNIVPSSGSTPAVRPRSLGQLVKLAKALKVCKEKPKRKRAACEAQARKRYGVKSSSAHKTKSSRANESLSTKTGR